LDSSGNIYVADYGNHTIRSSVQTAATITFGAIPTTVPGLGPFNVNPTSNSGGPIVLSSSDPAIASVNGFTITPLTAGTVTITATQASYLNFSAATPVSQTLVVNEFLEQTITFTNPNTPPKTDQSLVFAATVTASSGLPVVLTSSNPAVATVSGLNITPLAIGVTTITASQAGNLIYSPASTSRVLTISGTTATASVAIQTIQNCGDMQYYTGKEENIYVTTNPTQLAWPNSTTCRITPSSSSNKLSFGGAQLRNDGTTQFALNQAEPPDPGTKTLTFTLAETDKYARASVQKSILVSRPSLSISTYSQEISYSMYMSINAGPPTTSVAYGTGAEYENWTNDISADMSMKMFWVRLNPALLNCAGSYMSGGYANSNIPMIIFSTVPATVRYYNPDDTTVYPNAISSTIGYGVNLLNDTQKILLDIVPTTTVGVYLSGGGIITTGGGSGNVFKDNTIFGGEHITPPLVFSQNQQMLYKPPFMTTAIASNPSIDPRLRGASSNQLPGLEPYGVGTNDPRITRKIKPTARLVYIGSGYSGTIQQSNTVQTTLLEYINVKAQSESSPLLDSTKPRFGFSVYTSPYLPYRSGYVGDYYDMPPVQPTSLNYQNQFGGFYGSVNWSNFFALQPNITCYKIGEYTL
jgi:hypothetical protein